MAPPIHSNVVTVTDGPLCIRADLEVTKTVNNATPNEGDTIIYTITVTNNGPDDATGVQLTDVLPTGVTFGGYTATQGTYTSTTGLWTVSNLANHTSATLTITATVDSGTCGMTITNTASVTANQPDPEPDNNEASVNIDVLCIRADLGVAKMVNDPTPNEGDTIIYTITVNNNGPSDATSVQLTDTLPMGVTFGRYTATQGTYTGTTGLWTVDDIECGASATLTITATVDSGACITTITNTAHSLTAVQCDPNPDNNEDSVAITVTGADLAVTKTVDNATPNAGDVITYTITVTNNGPEDATGARLTDTLPTGVTFSWYTATQGIYTSTIGLWTVGEIECSASATLTITATVDSGTSGTTITNIARILTVDQPDPNPDNNEDSADINPTSAMYYLYLPIIYRNHCHPFIDTFDSPSSGWPVVDNAKLKTEYIAGEYRMLTKNSMLHYAYNLQFANYFTDYEIEVVARWASSTSAGKGYGIIFGLASDDSYAYLYQVNADWQTYRLLRYSSGSWYSLTNGGINNGWVYTDTIKSSLTTNRLKVIRSGSQIILYINNVYLETLVDGVITSGRVGLSVQSYYNDPVYGTRNADVRFDNYILNYCVGTASSVHAESIPSVSIPSIGALPRPD